MQIIKQIILILFKIHGTKHHPIQKRAGKVSVQTGEDAPIYINHLLLFRLGEH